MRPNTSASSSPPVEAAHADRWLAPAPLVVAIVGIAAIACYEAIPGADAKSVGYFVIGAAATAVMAVRTARGRPAERWGWWALTAANGLFVVGDGVASGYDLFGNATPPTPSIADALYLAGYPLLFAGVAGVTRLRFAASAREAYVDAGTLSVGALALSWHLLMHSYARADGVSTFGRLVTMAYPIMDVGVLFIVAGAVMAGSARRPADVLLGGAVVTMLVADFTYDLQVLHSTYVEGGPVDVTFLVNYVLMAAAAAHPSIARPAQRRGPSRSRLWLVVVATAAFVPSGLVLVCRAVGAPVDAGVLAAATVVLTALAVVRATLFVRRLRGQAAELRTRGESLAHALADQRALEQDLRNQVFFDPLTGLVNRVVLTGRLQYALKAPTVRPGTVWVCLLDLDAFKAVNDGGGHAVGDEVLIAVAKRLTGLVPVGDIVARLGGDEFAALLTTAEDMDMVQSLAERMLAVLREPVVVDGQEVVVSASLGIAVNGPGSTADRMLAEAGAALTEAKSAGKDRVAFYDADMGRRLADRMVLTTGLRTALAAREFDLEFQPQIRVADGGLEGFEALARWRHPQFGTVSPVRFVPLAEETGFVVPLGRWALRQACEEAATWTGVGASCTVSVNVSARQLQDPGFAGDVRAALEDSGLAPQRLVLEITETVLMTDPASASVLLSELKELGLRVAIDDFGTGYSSLSHLRAVPADLLKIDKSFIDQLDDPATEGRALVRTILRLAADLNLTTTAEGVEHERQLRVLQKLRCHTVQGYLFSRPLPAQATRDYIAGFERGVAVPSPA